MIGYALTQEDRKKIEEAGATKVIEGRPAPSSLEGLKNKTVIVASLSTLGRTPGEAVKTIKQMIILSIKLTVLGVGTFDNTENGLALLNALDKYEEFYKQLAVDRLRKGKQIAKTKPGFKEGRPRKDTSQAMYLLERGYDYETIRRITGISKSTILRRLGESKQ